jgi:hypothetical protein
VEIAGSLFLNVRRVGAMRHIEGNSDIRFTRECARRSAAQPDFFLHGRNTNNARTELATVKQSGDGAASTVGRLR